MRHAKGQACGHCGEIHREGLAYCVNVAGRELAMCCAGCAAVARLIAVMGTHPDRKKRDGNARRGS